MENPLCPDIDTLDRYLAGLLHFMNPHYYRTTAALELFPDWLDFLRSRELIDESQAKKVLHRAPKLIGDLVGYLESYRDDPIPRENLKAVLEKIETR